MFRLSRFAYPVRMITGFRCFSETSEPQAPPISPTAVLATRPLKGLLWGDGEVFLKYQRVKFKHNKKPSLKRIQKFLEHEQAKEITILDLKQYSQNTLFNTLMTCSGLSPRHISRIAYNLLKALKQAEVPDHEIFSVLGTRDSGWMILSMRDVHIHFITEELRPEINIEEVWKNPMTEAEKDEFVLDTFKMYKRFKRKKR